MVKKASVSISSARDHKAASFCAMQPFFLFAPGWLVIPFGIHFVDQRIPAQYHRIIQLAFIGQHKFQGGLNVLANSYVQRFRLFNDVYFFGFDGLIRSIMTGHYKKAYDA
jgi:hypothetical protein